MSKHPIWSAGHRLSLAWLSLACAAVTYFEPLSLMHANLDAGGYVGNILLFVIVSLAGVSLFDVVCNDISTTHSQPKLVRHRADTYMVQALSNLAFVFVLLKPGTWTWVASIYFVLACGSLWVSVWETLVTVKNRA